MWSTAAKSVDRPPGVTTLDSMPITAYAGVTGFTTRAEVREALSVVPMDRKLMCGVLLSTKSLQGERGKHFRRYPEPATIADIFVADKRVVNLLHVAFGNSLSPVLLGNLLSLVNRSGVMLLDGFQFNGTWPMNRDLDGLDESDFAHGLRVVLQVRPVKAEIAFADKEPIVRRNAIAQAREANAITRATDVLIDASLGRGDPIDVALADVYVRAFKKHAPRLHVGIAGGLCAREMPRVYDLVRGHDLSVDAEGQLRDGDDGGTLNLGAMKDYLKAAYQVQAVTP